MLTFCKIQCEVNILYAQTELLITPCSCVCVLCATSYHGIYVQYRWHAGGRRPFRSCTQVPKNRRGQVCCC